MNVGSVLVDLLRPRLSERATAVELFESEQPIRLMPTVSADDLPPEFEDVLKVQVLGHRERLTILYGHRLRVLDPIWTLVPKDR
jgi:hypothetical protein